MRTTDGTHGYLPAARADFLRRLGRPDEAREAYGEALLGTELRELASAVRRLPAAVGRVDASERVREG